MKVVGFPEGPDGPLVLEPPKDEDASGWASVLLCEEATGALGMPPITWVETVQSDAIGTVRGITWRNRPAGPSLYLCVRGAAHQVAIDLRPFSTTRLRHVSLDLTEVDGRGFLVPAGFGYGWQALTRLTAMVRIGMGAQTKVEGARPDDPKLGIQWPVSPILTSARDRAWEPM